jgi:hypothetical protein
MDEAFNVLAKNNENMFGSTFKTSANELLNDPALTKRRQDLTQPLPVLQTLALLQFAMQDESEIATVTHECTRQLVAATGLLPKNVNTAEWVQFGMASLFETPHQAFYPLTAGPNWHQLLNFKHLRQTKKLDAKKAKDVLLNVITDGYFNKAYASLHELYATKDEKDKHEGKTKEELELARSTAWALTYYLAHQKRDMFRDYLNELAQLPRDVEYDANVLKRTFARSFKLLTKDPNDPTKQAIDAGRLEQLATAWFSAMDRTSLDIMEVEKGELKLRKAIADAAAKAASRPTTPGAGAGSGRPGGPGMQPPYGGPGGRPGGPGSGYGPPGGSYNPPGGSGYGPPPPGGGKGGGPSGGS